MMTVTMKRKRRVKDGGEPRAGPPGGECCKQTFSEQSYSYRFEFSQPKADEEFRSIARNLPVGSIRRRGWALALVLRRKSPFCQAVTRRVN